jgi:hypothetical protein
MRQEQVEVRGSKRRAPNYIVLFLEMWLLVAAEAWITHTIKADEAGA